jgi:Glycine-rich domain
MTETLKVLGQSAPSAGSLTTVYTVPASTSAKVYAVLITNRSNKPTRFRIAISPGGAAIANQHYQYYDRVIEAQETYPATFGPLGVALATTDVVRVWNYDAVCSFSVHGHEVVAGTPSSAPTLLTVVQFTSGGTFTKGNYSNIFKVRVHAVGAGGGGGGATTTAAGETSGGAGGGGGAYASSLIAAASLGTTETVTVGAGGAGGTGSSSAGEGEDTSFGSHVVADGGSGGARRDALAPPHGYSAAGGGLVANCTGDIKVEGGSSLPLLMISTSRVWTGGGGNGSGPYGGGGYISELTASSAPGGDGHNYGGGGSGAANCQSQGTARTGGDGADGIVVVEVYSYA